MRKRRRLALAAAAVALVFSLAGLAGCSAGGDAEASGDGTLRVGVRADVVNFGYLNEQTDKYYGLEIDIANEMAQRMGYADVEFVTVTPDDRKEKLLEGEVDCLAACYSISDTRKKNFDFSPAYYSDSSVIMVENSSLIESVDQLMGHTFGAMSGSNTAPELVLKLQETGYTAGVADIMNLGEFNQLDTFALMQAPSYADLSRLLEEGAIDAACMDGAIAQSYMNDDRRLLDFDISVQDYGVATQKDSELSGQVASAIQGMIDDGTIAELTDKWN